MIWFTADLHISHANIIGYTGRPFKDVKQMNKVIKDNYNELVSDDDVVYILGDVSTWYNTSAHTIGKIVRKFKGRKILILGNHDKFDVFDYVDMGFESVHTHLYLEEEKLHLTHDPAVANIVPHAQWLCGHVHKLFKYTGNVINVGVDVWEYKPVSLDQIRSLINAINAERALFPDEDPESF